VIDLTIVHNGHIFLQSSSKPYNFSAHPFDEVVIEGDPRWNYIFFFIFFVPNVVVFIAYATFAFLLNNQSIAKYETQDLVSSAEVMGLLDNPIIGGESSPDRVGRRRADSPVGFVVQGHQHEHASSSAAIVTNNSSNTPIAKPVPKRSFSYHTEEPVQH